MENNLLIVKRVAIDSLDFDPANARKHSEANLSAIAGSLREFGQRKPIVVTSSGIVVAGNGTLEAARRLGWTHLDCVEVPVEWDESQVKAFALADNRTGELAEWNPVILSAQLLELEAEGFDITAIGFEKKIKEKELEEFETYDDKEETSYRCPKCAYEWNGSPR